MAPAYFKKDQLTLYQQDYAHYITTGPQTAPPHQWALHHDLIHDLVKV